METTVSGPARLEFFHRVVGGSMRIALDSLEFRLPDGVDLTGPKFTLNIPAGAHTVRWTYDCTAATGWAIVDGATLTAQSAPAISFATALDSPGREWVTTGLGWSTQTGGHDGVDSAKITANASLLTTVSGPAKVQFWWRGSVSGQFRPYQGTSGASTSWSQATAYLPRSISTLEVFANGLPFGTSSNFDEFTSTTLPEVSLAEALDTTDLTFSTSAANPWTGLQEAGIGVTNDAVCSNLGTFSCTVPGPGMLEFKARRAFASGSFQVRSFAIQTTTYTASSAYQTFSLSTAEDRPHALSFSASGLVLFDSFSFTPNYTSYYNSWMAVHGLSSFQDDRDRDGVPALHEWAFGLNPDVSDARPIQGNAPGLPRPIQVIVDGQPFLAIEFSRLSYAPGVRYVPEFGDGNSWSSLSVFVSSTAVNSTWVKSIYRDVVPVGQATRRLARLRVDLD
jgi:hypothetical protein